MEAAARFLPSGSPLDVLSLGEGQGRNAVHLASTGHRCTGVDASEVGLRKARRLAEERGVAHLVETVVADLQSYQPGAGRWDAVVSVFCALEPAARARLHAACVGGLRPGGVVIVECFVPSASTRGAFTAARPS